ncbi:glycosyltransferase [Rhodocytophaga aerolata]|uniref:Glycosyltransferase n=1 Tax=Rhodocytophaga aerolata TaxID=455078 RepID=A0ABT8R3C3_9BACT|nr:glycosyltransferase [Rhodocytophaga aerolata]MDO1445150.1 glycosyltransferase [Rhodocytophaga aerolata]
MLIVHVAEAFGGGIVDFVLSLTSQLKDHKHIIIYAQREIPIDVLKKRFDSGNVQFIEWKYAQREIKLLSDIKATYYLYSLLKNIKYDVIHLHSSKSGFLGRVAARFLNKRKVIYTPNGAPFVRTDISLFKKFFFVFLEKIADMLAGTVICCSRSEAEAYYQNNIKCSYINNGVAINPYPKNYTVNSTFKIVTAGRITYQKNPCLFNAIADHFSHQPDVEFIWIGEGELDYLLTAKNIRITGWLSKQQVEEEILKANVYLSTALWEGLPFAVLQAMNLGKPLLLSKCIGNIDLVKHGYNGHIYQSIDEASSFINYYIANRDFLQEASLNSYNYLLDNYNIQDMAKAYLNKYESV